MRPSSLGGGRILRRTLSVRLSVRPVIVFVYFFYSRTVIRANIQNRKTSVFAYWPASRMYFSARTEGRISYGHLGRTNLLNYVNTFDIVKQGDIKLRQKVETVHAFSCRLILFSYAFSGQQSDKIIRSYKLPILPTDKSLYEIQ